MKFAMFLLIAVLSGSCFSDGNCLITATNYVHIQFKKETNKLDSALDLTAIYVSGTDTSLVINAATSEILLPIDIHSNTTTFILQRTNSLNKPPVSDTLRVGYSTQSKVIAKDCGAFTYYQNLKILHTNLKDSQIKAFSTSLLTDPTLYVAGAVTYQAYAVNYQIFY
jgi:hypothetical protein